jgi:D-beta-D-heptose 7-phosphate kinase/D-beta-D-heptose 1-phosphate adenosyltransferase
MHEKLLKIVTNLGSPKILLVGDFMLDVYVYGDATRISPEAPVPVLKVTKTEHSCGGAGSVAANLAALDAVPLCLGIIGKDQNGETLKKMLTEMGADISGLLTVTNRPTVTKQRLIGLAQHRHRQQLMRIDEECTEPLSDEENEKILETYRSELNEADIVCLQDYDKGLLSPSVCKQMVQLARDAKKKVLVDPCLVGDYSKYADATLIAPNRQEASGAVSFDIKTIEDAGRAAKKLLEDFNISAVVITLDREGAYLRTTKKSEIITTRPRAVYDVTGAGDMVLATLAIILAEGYEYETAVQLANITAGIEVEKFGAATVYKEEIIKDIKGKDIVGKVYTIDSLLQELAQHRKHRKSIVFTNGCFDVVHKGHTELLKFCKLQGDIVVVGLNSDGSTKAIKGSDRPINSQDDRAAVLAALETVDYVSIFDERTPLNLIKKVKPDILVKGRDWAGKGVVGQEFVESYGGKVVLAPIVEGKSTTVTIEKIKSIEVSTLKKSDE